MKKAFTLVELLVAVCILSVGIVMVLRSFLTAYDALESAQSRLRAVEFLQAKMAELEVQAKKEGGVAADMAEEEEVVLGSRKAVYKSAIVPEEELAELSYRQVKLTLSWQEANRNKESVLSAYMNVIEKKEEE